MTKSSYEFTIFLITATIVGLEGRSSSYQTYQSKIKNEKEQQIIRQKSSSPNYKMQALAPEKRHDKFGPDSPLAQGVAEFLTPWPSAAYITDTTHPLMVKLLLSVVAPILCVLIALQAYVTYYGPSNSYDGSWTVPLSDPAAPGIAVAG